MTSRKPTLRHVPTAVAVALCAAACAVSSPPGEPVATAASALGNEIEYCNFGSVAGLQLNGNAAQVLTTLRLSTNATNQDSSAFRTATLPLTATTSFHTHFQFVLTPTVNDQADGVVFVLQNDARGDTALGGNGGGIGYGNANGGTAITPSVEVELDTYQNTWDPNANHVGVMINGDQTTHVAVATPTFALASATPIDVWIDYTAATTTLQVFLSNTGGTKPATALLTTAAVNVFTTVGAAGYFGFTGSTGGSSETQVLNSWILSLEGLSECACTSNAQCGGTTPYCELPPGTCVQCLTSPNCSGQTPVCSPTAFTCGPCTSNTQCSGTTPYCAPTGDPLAGACVACVTTAECDGTPTTATPICNKSGAGVDACRGCLSSAECVTAALEPVCVTTGAHDGQCAQCSTNADCTASAATPVCVNTGATNQCEQCGTNADCSGKTPICSSTYTCGPCTSDASCAAPTPACQTGGALQGECTQCSATNTSQCTGATPSCNTTTGTCSGCDVDTDCAKGNWCDESIHTCEATLTNGTPVPTDPAHMNPTLDGMCTTAAGALVCQSGVCDTKDNECGYANGDGPCTATNGSIVCRSGSCSPGGVCEPAGGCVTDADCTGGKWCDESTSTCTAKLPNGTVVPTDPPHMNPTLDGMCTTAAATLVCQSGVCDPKDNECGYANGDGPCTVGDGPTVCRSGDCSVTGTCEPTGGCNANGDCPNPAQPVCNTATHMCEGSDGGVTVDSGLGDSGAPKDAGGDASSSDAAPSSDAGSGTDGAAGQDGAADAEADAAEPGYLEGGGLSCGVSTGRGEPLTIAAFAALTLLGTARRRRVRARG